MCDPDETWMQQALLEADQAILHGDVPVGCVVVDADGTELSRAHNRRELDGDPTAHAEVLALRGACARRGHWRLDGTTVFVTLEPCAMCAGALVNARVTRLVFGATDPKAGAVTSLYQIPTDARLNHRLAVRGQVMADAAAARLQTFFARLRAAGEK
jgi:tRNA(adenine34) deaminase